MIIARLEQMKGGWIAGDFEPNVIRTSDYEVAVKEYNRGDYEKRHYHKQATEITVIGIGRVRMNNVVYEKGDIIIIEPFERTDFEALTHTITTVIKYPSVHNDKYWDEQDD